MVTRRTVLGALAATVVPVSVKAADHEREPEFLEDRLRATSLPPLAQRIPKRPRIINLKEMGRVEYVSATDDEAVEAFQLLCKLEGIIPALESAHGLAHAMRLAPTLPNDNLLVLNLSGRGDKDVPQIAERLGMKI